MIDQIYDRGYQAARTQLNAGLHDLFADFFHSVGDSLKVLHRIEWNAPWQQSATRCAPK